MNKAFEKIIEKLEKKIKEYDERIERRNGECYFDESDKIRKLDDTANGIEQAIEIVKRVATEYNNGWIPCSERLPEEPKENALFEYKALELYLVTSKYGSSEQDKKYPFRAFWNGINFTDGMNILDVIAWQPLPEPYKEK